MKTLRVSLIGFLALLTVACGSLLPAARSFGDKVNYADSLLTGIVNATAVSLESNQLTVSEAKSVREIANQAKTFLDSARAAEGTAGGEQNLQLAVTVLQQLQTYLNQRTDQ